MDIEGYQIKVKTDNPGSRGRIVIIKSNSFYNNWDAPTNLPKYKEKKRPHRKTVHVITYSMIAMCPLSWGTAPGYLKTNLCVAVKTKYCRCN